MDPERRFCELRHDGDARLSGVAMPYETEAVLPWGRERFEVGAFGGVGDLDVILTVQHDRGRALARTGGGGLTLEDGPEALLVRADLVPTREATDALALVKAGVLRGLSIEFRATRERFAGDVRIVQSADLVAVSVVDRPAYDAATVQARASATGDPAPVLWWAL